MNRYLTKISYLAIFISAGLLTIAVYAADPVFQSLETVKWEPAPPALPPGAQTAILSGNPMEAGPYTILAKLPADYKIPAHSHPADENLTILSGTLYMGMGDKLDTASGKPLGVGGYALMPANMNHFVYTKEETVFSVYGQGPIDFKYVNPADDPRNAK